MSAHFLDKDRDCDFRLLLKLKIKLNLDLGHVSEDQGVIRLIKEVLNFLVFGPIY